MVVSFYFLISIFLALVYYKVKYKQFVGLCDDDSIIFPFVLIMKAFLDSPSLGTFDIFSFFRSYNVNRSRSFLGPLGTLFEVDLMCFKLCSKLYKTFVIIVESSIFLLFMPFSCLMMIFNHPRKLSFSFTSILYL